RNDSGACEVPGGADILILSGELLSGGKRGSVMNLILFFIFLLCDLMMVPICWFSFGKQSEYREGMLLGVHIPSDCIGDPEVSAICTGQEKDWKRFQRI